MKEEKQENKSAKQKWQDMRAQKQQTGCSVRQA